jgi:uncharacterized HAD superfamily protein
MRNEKRIGLDVDGVLADSAGYLMGRLGLDPEKNRYWAWTRSFGDGWDEKVTELYQTPEIWVGPKPLPGATSAVDLLLRKDYEITLITAIQPFYLPLRKWWLDWWFGEGAFKNVLAVRGNEKAAVASILGLSAFVEDKWQTANEMAEAGIRSILVPSNYMDDSGEATIDPRVEVKTLAQFAEEAE